MMLLLFVLFHYCANFYCNSIIAVHGLNGHAYGTWAHHEDGQPAFEAMWLRDFLPHNVKTARVLVYGYNSALLGLNVSVSGVKDFAHDLLQRIIDDRADQVRDPIFFVIDTYSLGRVTALDLCMPLIGRDCGEAGKGLL